MAQDSLSGARGTLDNCQQQKLRAKKQSLQVPPCPPRTKSAAWLRDFDLSWDFLEWLAQQATSSIEAGRQVVFLCFSYRSLRL